MKLSFNLKKHVKMMELLGNSNVTISLMNLAKLFSKVLLCTFICLTIIVFQLHKVK